MPPFTHKRDHGAPASFWWTGNPTTGPTGTATTWVGVRFHISVPGRIEGLSFYDSWGDPTLSPTYSLLQLIDWASVRQMHRAGQYQAAASGPARWNTVWMRPWFRIIPNHEYIAAALYVGGGFYRTNSALTTPVTRNNITFTSSFQSTSLDLSGAIFSEVLNANAIDVIFRPD